MPLLSKKEQPIDDEICKFLETHIEKHMADDRLKSAEFFLEENTAASLVNNLSKDPKSFLDTSSKLSQIVQYILP